VDLENWFQENEAAYAIYFLDNSEGSYIFISYVPDNTDVTPLPLR